MATLMDTIVARIVAGYCDATIEMRVLIVCLFAARMDRARIRFSPLHISPPLFLLSFFSFTETTSPRLGSLSSRWYVFYNTHAAATNGWSAARRAERSD